MKVDVDVPKDRAYDYEVMRRVRRKRVVWPGGPMNLPLESPEDVLLSKLTRSRMGGEVSERQWHDALGVLRLQAPVLDQAYLDLWASDLGVTDLLARARQQAAL